MAERYCLYCGNQLVRARYGPPKQFCSIICRNRIRDRPSHRCYECGTEMLAIRQRYHVSCARLREARKQVRLDRIRLARDWDDAYIENARRTFPSVNRDWDAEMVAMCADRLMPLLTRKVKRLNNHVPVWLRDLDDAPGP